MAILIIEAKTLILTILLDSLFATSEIKSDITVQEVQQLNFMDFLIELFASEKFNDCSLHFFTIQTEHSTNYSVNDLWAESDTFVTSGVRTTINTNGVVISEVQKLVRNSSEIYQQPQKISYSRRWSIVVIILLNLFSTNVDDMMKTQISPNILYPPTIRNRDNYLILTRQDLVKNIQNSMFIKSVKYKLILVIKHSQDYTSTFSWNYTSTLFQVKVMRICPHGICGEVLRAKNTLNSKYTLSYINSLFPDQERNFFGHNLRIATTLKVPQILEIELEKDIDGNDEFIPKRGLYAFVISEVSKRLNFTYTIVPSSGGSSTGHALPNGTWVGTVGDVLKGVADFGLCVAMTSQRFPNAEFCAPVNIAYFGFVTGLPRKSFTWKAILWPLSPTTWVGVVGSTCISSLLLLLFAHSTLDLIYFVESNKIWEYIVAASYLIRALLEQCPGLPRYGNSVSFKTFFTFWLMFSLVISTVYRSKMVSLLTFPTLEHVPVNFDELALDKGFAVDFHYFGNVETYFTSKNPSYKKIAKRMGLEPDPVVCMERTIQEKSACITFILTFKETLYRNLSDQYGNSPLKFVPDGAVFRAGMIHQHKAPLSSNFKFILASGMETGLIPFWEQSDLNTGLNNKNRWQKMNNIEPLTWDDGNDSILHVRNLQGPFVVLILGLIAAIFSFLVENRKRYTTFLCFKITVKICHFFSPKKLYAFLSCNELNQPLP